MRTASERLRQQLQDVLQNLHAELDRVEILAAALSAFSAPVPDYKSAFRHMMPVGRDLEHYQLASLVSKKT